MLVVVALLVAGVATAGLLGAFSRPRTSVTPMRHIVYTARTGNDAAIDLPEAVRADLRQVGLKHGSITVTRVDSTSHTDTQIVDLTPRAGDSPDAPVLKVPERAGEAVDAALDDLEARMNASRASTGDHALFGGLTKTEFQGAPVVIVSSGLDLSSPVDFRALNWGVPADVVVENVRAAGELPDLHGAQVTFVVVPSSGGQEQLREAQKRYRAEVWNALLSAAGASTVTYVEASGTGLAGDRTAPAVSVPALPDTPIKPVSDPDDPGRTLCRLPSATYFRFGEPELLDRRRTVDDLRPCIAAALASDAVLELDGYASYEGALDRRGEPIVDSAANRELSEARAQAIADLLVNDMHVPRSRIVRVTGHGNTDQPDPDPRSPANRLVVVGYVARPAGS